MASIFTFTVNADGDKVEFSPGNLYYDGSSWHFEAHQWDYRTYQGLDAFIDGETPVTKTPDGHWGLFGRSAGNPNTPWGMSISTTSSDYKGDFEDWGKTMDATGDTWRTLKFDEWKYLFYDRPINGNKRYAWAELTNGINGLIIFPDNYTGATDLNYIPEGAVFLPAAGFRYNYDPRLDYEGSSGYYRSYSEGTIRSYYFFFNKTSLSCTDMMSLSCGYSVRLVRDCSK